MKNLEICKNGKMKEWEWRKKIWKKNKWEHKTNKEWQKENTKTIKNGRTSMNGRIQQTKRSNQSAHFSQDKTGDINVAIYISTPSPGRPIQLLTTTAYTTPACLASLASLGAGLVSCVLAWPRRVYPRDGPKARWDNTVSLLIITLLGCRDDAPPDRRETKTIA